MPACWTLNAGRKSSSIEKKHDLPFLFQRLVDGVMKRAADRTFCAFFTNPQVDQLYFRHWKCVHATGQ